jgi:hypothetical protein
MNVGTSIAQICSVETRLARRGVKNYSVTDISVISQKKGIHLIFELSKGNFLGKVAEKYPKRVIAQP